MSLFVSKKKVTDSNPKVEKGQLQDLIGQILEEHPASFVFILMCNLVSRVYQPTSEGESIVQIIVFTVKSHTGILLFKYDSSEFG